MKNGRLANSKKNSKNFLCKKDENKKKNTKREDSRFFATYFIISKFDRRKFFIISKILSLVVRKNPRGTFFSYH